MKDCNIVASELTKSNEIKWYYLDNNEFKSVNEIVKDYYDNNIMVSKSSGNAIALKTRKQRRF